MIPRTLSDLCRRRCLGKCENIFNSQLVISFFPCEKEIRKERMKGHYDRRVFFIASFLYST